MGQIQQGNSFRFLSEAEFAALNAKDRAAYLVRATGELDRHREILGALTQIHIHMQKKGD